MEKDNYRDYVVEAMRYYAICGCPSEDDLRKLKNVLPEEGIASYYDLLAVQHMLYRLGREEYGPRAVECVKRVYIKKTTSRQDISTRVSIAAMELSVCETWIYKALRRARILVALERGLRVNDEADVIVEDLIRQK